MSGTFRATIVQTGMTASGIQVPEAIALIREGRVR